MRTYLIYFGLILGGLILGWLIFSGRQADRVAHDHDHEAPGVASEYTCSMHPQIRQDEPGNCPICGMELIPVSRQEDAHLDDPFLMTMTEGEVTWANIRTAIVESTDQGALISLTGQVAADERQTRLITAAFPGRIEQLYADFTGMFVRQGQRLARIYSPELMQAQQELIMAARQREQQPRLYRAARSRLQLFNLTEAQIDQIEESGEASPTLNIYSVQSGYITSREVSQGDYVSTGQTLFAIARLDRVWVELDAYEEQMGRISQGQQATIVVPALPGQELSARVEFVDPFVDPQTRTARIRLTVDNPENRLRPGMFVTARIMGSPQEGALPVIPHTAVLWTGQRSIVYVKQPGDHGFTFAYREIETGDRLQETYQVLQGLSVGEEIAVSGAFAIDAAAQLRGHYSMMAPPQVIALPEPFRSNLQELFQVYFDIKNALTEDDQQAAAEHATRLPQQLDVVGEHSLAGEHHMFWMGQYAAKRQAAENFLAATTIEQQRVIFEPLSEAFIETARTLGAIGQTWYVAFCPMVDDNRGAYWLSEFEEILNPYFGSAMLRCGEVTETIREGVGQPRDEPRPVDVHAH